MLVKISNSFYVKTVCFTKIKIEERQQFRTHLVYCTSFLVFKKLKAGEYREQIKRNIW